jgi:hypothetical protein
MHQTLTLAGIYNLVWGALVVLWPHLTLQWFHYPPQSLPQLWQCIGMIVGVYGIGYLAAARAPLIHWPVVLVGFLGKVFGPIGFVDAAIRGVLPWRAGWVNVTNDVIWWIPFGLILWHAWKFHHRDARSSRN